MKKNIVVFALSCMPLCVAVDNQTDATYPASDARSITYKITLYREDTYDQKAWAKLVADASTAIKKAGELQDDASAATNEIVDAFVRGIEEVYKQSNVGVQGVHGQMSIEVADNLDDQMVEDMFRNEKCQSADNRTKKEMDASCKGTCNS